MKISKIVVIFLVFSLILAPCLVLAQGSASSKDSKSSSKMPFIVAGTVGVLSLISGLAMGAFIMPVVIGSVIASGVAYAAVKLLSDASRKSRAEHIAEQKNPMAGEASIAKKELVPLPVIETPIPKGLDSSTAYDLYTAAYKKYTDALNAGDNEQAKKALAEYQTYSGYYRSLAKQ